MYNVMTNSIVQYVLMIHAVCKIYTMGQLNKRIYQLNTMLNPDQIMEMTMWTNKNA